jgi:hypothetical protein
MTETKRMGRPPLPDGLAKTARVELRLLPALKAAWQAKADAEGLTLQAWIEKKCGKTPLKQQEQK